jgi:hypothetical protein
MGLLGVDMSGEVSKPQIVKQPRFTGGPAVVWYVAGALLVFHLSTANRYGYFGDELYHMACGEHLSWGYVDQPPLIAIFTWLTRHLFGTSVFAVHLLPAFAGFALVWLTGLIARELGGGRFAQGFSALCVACAGVYFVFYHIYTMNAFEPLIWTGCAWVVIRIVKTGNQKMWLWFGLFAGIGLENKYSMGVFAFAIVVGLLLTDERKALARKWIWIAGLIAFAIFLPNLIWNILNHFPFLELMHNIRASGRDVVFTPAGYIKAQILLMTPVTFPVWLLGTIYFLFWKEGRPFRLLGYAFLAVLGVFIAMHGKDYYAVSVYPMMFAGGAIAIERWTAARNGWLKPALVVFILAGAIAFLPMVAPVLSPEGLVQYLAKLPFKIQPDEKSMLLEPLPHYFSWCFGWEEMVQAVAKAYETVPVEERADTAIMANDFAAAGAIDLIGPKYGLPKSICGHQSYWLWGPRHYTGKTMILVGDTPKGAGRWFNEVKVIAELNHPFAAPWENRPVLLCRGPKGFNSLSEAWPRLKDWD